MRRIWSVLAPLAAVGVIVGIFGACEGEPYRPTTGGGTQKQGESCTQSSECIFGLECSGYSTCQPMGQGVPGTKRFGEDCSTYVDCLREYTCAAWGKCITSKGTAKEGESCKSHDQCTAELLCSAKGTCQKRGGAGTKDVGATCAAADDCALGLVCDNKKCTALGYWAGASCKGKDDGPLRALFRVPRAGKTDPEFYALPFPNDIRLSKDGKVDVSDHPNPRGVLPEPYGTVVSDMLKVISEEVSGFGLNTTVYLRTSKALDYKTLTITGTNPTLEFLNIDKASSGYGNSVALNMFATSARGKYICENSIAVRPRVGAPLSPKTTYAVLLRKGVKDGAGTLVAQDDDFKVMLGAGEPSDADLKAAWTAYAPLRAYLKDKQIAADGVLSAAVFTTMDVRARMGALRQAVHQSGPAAKLDKLTLCDGKNASPCADPNYPGHVCPAHPSAAHDELQALLEVPVFQAGTRPYKTVTDGGNITYDSAGAPKVLGTEKICLSMTVPKATMPAAGWPVVLYGHGTGGNFRTYATNGTAEGLRTVTDPDNSANESKMVVISVDGALHGPRSNTTDKPDAYVFNPLNLRASRDNVYQEAADKFQLVRLVKSLVLAPSQSPTGQSLKFDPKKVYYFGHSQGASVGVPFLALEPDVSAAVLSGAGGYLIGSLLEKKKPVNIAGAVYLALGDPFIGTSHPVLNLMQLLYEEVDPVNYGSGMYKETETGVGPKHIFMSMGLSDSFTPLGTQKALAWAMNLRRVKQTAERCGDGVCSGLETCASCKGDCGACLTAAACGNAACEASEGETCRNCPGDCRTCPAEFAEVSAPVKGNIVLPGKLITAGLVQYIGDGSYDDHFVIFNEKNAKPQHRHFLGSAAWDKDGVPTIPKAQ